MNVVWGLAFPAQAPATDRGSSCKVAVITGPGAVRSASCGTVDTRRLLKAHLRGGQHVMLSQMILSLTQSLAVLAAHLAILASQPALASSLQS